STPELWLLLRQFGPAFILGIEDPYPGWLAEEEADAHRKAAENLLSRGLAKASDEKTIDVDDALYEIAAIIAHPQHTIILQISSSKGDGSQRYYYLSGNQVVERELLEQDSHLLRRTAAGNSFLKGLAELMHPASALQGNGEEFLISQDALYKASELAAAGDLPGLAEVVSNSGLSLEQASALQSALLHTAANASIAVVANMGDPETQHVSGFGILESEHDLWMMAPCEIHGQPYVELKPANHADILQRLSEIIPGFQPEMGKNT
ncbi:MAG TPA: ESX secretion-associated protein EspG, partial [Anaerolineaceae bacterium]|nr:ESX secretion-associated protein EspG [Anaerolineaceae bacterium]